MPLLQLGEKLMSAYKERKGGTETSDFTGLSENLESRMAGSQCPSA